ncbi:dNTP triphosphohydrolase [Amnibacterium soli]|uniref:DNTP triphosphohydrolase n=1 Tax=Amnibacterium soli TaxID=1282736 RepID=A0ABP8YU82_9MICO
MPASSFGSTRPVGRHRDDEAWRSSYQTDYDRLLYAPEFRRLSGVTQVMSPQQNYVMHDRLTHSLKVSQTAERTAQFVISTYAKEHGQTYGASARALKDQLIPAVCAVAGLAHDLGHPPFGHAAEQELQALLGSGLSVLSVKGRPVLTDSFEGNAQSFRIVARLSLRKHELDAKREEKGLNLTWRSLGAIAKYPWLHGEHPPQFPKFADKWNFYNAEGAYLEHLRSTGVTHRYGDSALRQSLEAQVMDWADDIAYAVHDLEDFYRTQRMPLNELRARPVHLAVDKDDDEIAEDPPSLPDVDEVWESLIELTFNRLRGELPNVYAGTSDPIDRASLFSIAENVRGLFPARPFDGSLDAHAVLQAFSSSLIRQLQSGARLVEAKTGALLLEVAPVARLTAELLKSITHMYVINTPGVAMMQRGQRRAIRELFTYLHEMAVATFVDGRGGAAGERRLPAKLVEYGRLAMASTDLDDYRNDEARVARAVLDYLCTLTDAQTSLLHQRLTGDAIADQAPYWLNT